MKAMLLAAGRGERLRPLTDTTPKPLIRVGARCLIEYNILQLKTAGVSDIVINVCYKAQNIIRYLGNGSRYGVNLEYSFEGDQPLGTGGGVYRALTLLGVEPFWLLSADIWSQYRFPAMALAENIDAHLVLVPNPDFHPNGDYALCADGRLSQEGSARQTYGNIAFLRPCFFQGSPHGAFPISQLFAKAIKQDRIRAELYRGPWFNVGDQPQLAKLNQFIQQFPPQMA